MKEGKPPGRKGATKPPWVPSKVDKASASPSACIKKPRKGPEAPSDLGDNHTRETTGAHANCKPAAKKGKHNKQREREREGPCTASDH